MSTDQRSEIFTKPAYEADSGAVWSNFDHVLDVEVAKQLEAAPGELCAQHAAWNFCGYVWKLPDGRWVNQVWRFNSLVEDIVGDGLEDVIQRANQEYGYD